MTVIRNAIGNPESGSLQSGTSSNELNLLRKENEFLRIEVKKSKIDTTKQRK